MNRRLKVFLAFGLSGAVMGGVAVAGASFFGGGRERHANPGPVGGVIRPDTGVFSAAANFGDVNVTCAAGATTGTVAVPVGIMARRGDDTDSGGGLLPGGLGATLGLSDRVVVSYPGGEFTLPRFDELHMLTDDPNLHFPCPATEGAAGDLTFVLQPYQGDRKVGTAAMISLRLHRVGSSS